MTSGHATGAEARFLAAIPGARVALLGLRPLAPAYLARVRTLFGADAEAAIQSATGPSPSAAATERDRLAALLFAPPETLVAGNSPVGPGPDGSVELEEHAGVEAELEATADWVAREISVHATPLAEIAVLAPAADPVLGLVAERLGRLPGTDGAIRVFVAGGLAATRTATGARMMAVLAALGEHLSVESMARVLPVLRSVREGFSHLSHGRAMEIAYALGTRG